MSWIDKQEDYYLHDFSKESETSATPQPAPQTQPEQPGQSSQPQFQFSQSAGEPERRAPRRHRGRKVLLWFIFIVLVAGGVAFWLRYLNPYTVDSLVTGYITNVDRQGLFFKTYEGQMISEGLAGDSAQVYQHDVRFSIPSPELALELLSLQGTGRKVTLVTEKFYGVLPWRGASNVVVTGIK